VFGTERNSGAHYGNQPVSQQLEQQRGRAAQGIQSYHPINQNVSLLDAKVQPSSAQRTNDEAALIPKRYF